MSLFDSGIRPAINDYMDAQRKEVRDYGEYWSASSAGYCHRKLVFERLGVPPIEKEGDDRKYRVFESGKIFHEWIQRITKESGLSIAQELELQDDELMVRGHIDDLVLIKALPVRKGDIAEGINAIDYIDRLILYDYKTQHSGAFTWQKYRPISYHHRLQVGTYMYMLRKRGEQIRKDGERPQGVDASVLNSSVADLAEARVLKISKDDLRMNENQVLWDAQLEADVMDYWVALNGFWKERKMPECTCADHEGGFMAKEKFNPFWYEGEPCSLKYYDMWKANKLEEG